MMTFNAAAREVCIVRTDLTTTPLQALTLMNNKTFVEAARFLAERMLRQDSAPRERIAWAFRTAVSRPPTAGELKLLEADLAFYEKDFVAQPAEADKLLKVGEKPADAKLSPTTLAAYTLVANTILNLDEAITQN